MIKRIKNKPCRIEWLKPIMFVEELVKFIIIIPIKIIQNLEMYHG